VGDHRETCAKVYLLFKTNLFLNALANSRRSLQIVYAFKKTDKPDLIVAHNLGALYPAYVLSKKWQIPFNFDVEDYHPGEFIRHDAKNEKARREFLMKRLLPKASAITCASPLIGEQVALLLSSQREEDKKEALKNQLSYSIVFLKTSSFLPKLTANS
jgi:hypothetical protein